jgi:hypothetical protein
MGFFIQSSVGLLMKSSWIIISILVLFSIGSCSTLEQSKSGSLMKYQGSFSCDALPDEALADHTLAEKDVARVRCAKDEWKITPDEIVFTRTLFMSAHCETLLGKFTFKGHYDNEGKKLVLHHPSCKIIRASNGWLGENSGKCLLKDLNLNTPYALNHQNYPCSNFVPAFCKSATSTLEIEPSDSQAEGSHEPYDHLTFTGKPSEKTMTCKRYANE